MKKAKFVDNLKLRFSWGENGNRDIGRYAALSRLVVTDAIQNGSHIIGVWTDNLANNNLKWERTSSLNGGVEFSLLDRRLMISSDVFYKKTKDAFLQKNISQVNGLEAYTVNSGEITNKGYNVSLTVSPVYTDNVRWMLSTSISKSKNKVETQASTDEFDLENFLNGTVITEGESVNTFFSYKFRGLNPVNGGPLFDDYEETPERLYGKSKYEVFTTVLEPSGSREPTLSGSINNTVNFWDFRLNMSLAYSLGAKTRLFKLYADDYGRIRPENNLNRAFLNRWQYPGDEKYTSIPVFIAAGGSDSYLYHWSGFTDGMVPEIASTGWEEYNYSNIRVVSANYLKCTNIALTYNIKAERLGCSLLEVQASVSNPFVWSSKELQGQTPVQSGFTEIQLSERPTFTLGLNVTF